MTRVYCSRLSAEDDEPLAGTAAGPTHTWLGIEIFGAWEPKALMSPGVSAELREVLSQWQAVAGRRVQLLKARDGEAPRAWLASDSGVLRWAMGSVGELATALASGPPASAERVTEPVIWVCTHGKRDLCCARWGMPVYRTLLEQGGITAMQTTHLGGHRFAATALALPSRVLYGRIGADEACDLAFEISQGRLWPDRMRGRTSLSPRAQAAEVALRQHLNDPADNLLAVTESEDAVHLSLTTGQWSVHTERVPGPPRLASCDASEPKATASWRCQVVPQR